MKKMIKVLLRELILSMVLVALFPSAFLKDEARWTYRSDVGRVDVAFAGDVSDGQIEVHGKELRVERARWIRDAKGNQGVVVQFPISYLRKNYQIELTPQGNTKDISLVINFLGKDLKIGNQRQPAYVCFENIRINGKSIAQEATVWHDKPFKHYAKNIPVNSTVTLSFKIRKPITPSDVKWGILIELFIVVGLLIFYFDAPKKQGDKGSIFMEREDGMQCNIKDGAQRLRAVEFLGNQDKKIFRRLHFTVGVFFHLPFRTHSSRAIILFYRHDAVQEGS